MAIALSTILIGLLLSHCILGLQRRLLASVSLQRLRLPSPLSSRCSSSISAARRLVGAAFRLINGCSAQQAFYASHLRRYRVLGRARGSTRDLRSNDTVLR